MTNKILNSKSFDQVKAKKGISYSIVNFTPPCPITPLRIKLYIIPSQSINSLCLMNIQLRYLNRLQPREPGIPTTLEYKPISSVIQNQIIEYEFTFPNDCYYDFLENIILNIDQFDYTFYSRFYYY